MGLNKKKLFGGLFLVFLFLIIVQIIRGSFADEEKQLRSQVRESVQEQFPDEYQQMQAAFGLQEFTLATATTQEDEGKGWVVLVHGLDDPGIIWQNLAPVLVESGYRVWLLNYPNDQPIVDSAIFFEQELERFTAKHGQNKVAVICHSMGGLVSREMLTSPDIGYGKKVTAGLVPDVSHLLMIGTPNHGSLFSRLRIFTEIRDQLVNAGKKEFHWLRPVFDGMGEAGIDLYPGSDFLVQLNSRPPAEVPNKLVVAGVMSPIEQKDLQERFEELGQVLPDSGHLFEKFERLLEEMISGVGDGLVSVNSARLDGVELVQVQGTHVSIIRNILSDSSRIPPAIPVILEALAEMQD